MIDKPAKYLYDLICEDGTIILDKPNVEIAARVSEPLKQLYMIENEKGMFKAGYGPIYEANDYIFTKTKEEAFKYLLDAIKSLGNKIKFNILVMPNKGVESSTMEVFNSVIMRIVEYYDIGSDAIYTRYDILIRESN